MPTVQQLLNDVRVRLPASTATFTDGVVIGWMNDCQNEVWRYGSSTEMYEFDVVNGQSIYSLASDMKIDMVKSVQVSNSTVIDGTESYSDYKYAGMDDELSGNHYYNALDQIGFYPEFSTNDGGKNVKIIYEPSPVQLSTDTLNIVPSINAEYQDILKFRAMKIIAQSGNAPDVELANNYQAEEDRILHEIKTNYYKRKAKNPRSKRSYREGW